MKNFFVGRGVGFLVLIVLGLIVFGIKTYVYDNRTTEMLPVAENFKKSEAISFNWNFTQADSLNPDGNPETNIFLEIGYSDLSVLSKLIDIVPMSCNLLEDTKEITALKSKVIQCYGAGLGYLFKVTKGENSYKVERKTFEEASPEYVPPVSEYEVIAEFPLLK